MTMQRMSVSLPADLVSAVREVAGRTGEPVSRVVARAVRDMWVTEMRQEIVDAAVEDAEWNQRLARTGRDD